MTQTIATPIEVTVPMNTVIDHGMTLVHELGGKPRNYLHEVSVIDGDNEAVAYLSDAKYSCDSGYRNNGIQYWTYRKAYPLAVASW